MMMIELLTITSNDVKLKVAYSVDGVEKSALFDDPHIGYAGELNDWLLPQIQALEA
jgi:hypothetical protein